ncbi:MAG: AI-2E family transporter [Chloroflexi bacterium]|nr:AI-2E family transporter [Chloroflexota bacterium]
MTNQAPESPQWTPTTKLVVGLTLVAVVAALLIRFSNLIGPLLIAFMLSYVLHPLTNRLHSRSELSWRGAVNLIYLVFVLAIILLTTLSGFVILDELQNLIRVVQKFVVGLPELLQNLSTQAYVIGPFDFDFATLETYLNETLGLTFVTLGEQTLSTLQPILGGAGTLLGSLATSALTTIGWGAFVLIISYFILADAGQVPDFFKSIDLLGHDADLRRLGKELARIWNAFVRGQLLLFSMIVVSSFLLMSILGVRNALGLAFLAGLAKFVPYVGPLIAGLVTALVAFFQSANYLGIGPPLLYATIVVVAAVVMDQIFDNLVTPRIYGKALGVHPAAVLVAALIAANLLGLVGLLLAAPVLASLQLFAIYALRKMLDLDPWTSFPEGRQIIENPLARPLQGIRQIAGKLLVKIRDRIAAGEKNE